MKFSQRQVSHSIVLTSLLTVIFSANFNIANADEAELFKPWLVRGGVSLIAPKSDNGSILNNTADITIDNRAGPTVTLSYFFSPNWAIDVLGGLPFKHKINVNGTQAGEAKHLPPILSLQYHFFPENRLRPFVGAGINYTTFLDEKLDNGADLKLKDSWGPAFQAGFDYAINNSWSVGADVRYAKIKTDTEINGVKVGQVAIDPIVYSLNVGYRF